MRPAFLLLLFALLSLSTLAGCAIPGLSGIGVPNPQNPPDLLIYEGAIGVGVQNGKPLAGTDLGYQGKSVDGRALVLIGKQQAAKQTGDSVYYSGAPMPGVKLVLNTRVTTYDQNTVNLLGSIRIEILAAQPAASPISEQVLSAFSIPVQYSVDRNRTIPGTTVQFLGSQPQGAWFSDIGEYPYRQQFDSVVWSGHLRDKLALKTDLRIVAISQDNVSLFGTAQIRFEK